MNSNSIYDQNHYQQKQQQQQVLLTPPKNKINNNELNINDYSPSTILSNQLSNLNLNSNSPNKLLSLSFMKEEKEVKDNSNSIVVKERDDENVNNNNEQQHQQELNQINLIKNVRDEEKDELNLLSISSLITELNLILEDINTLIFEIQELRHTTSSNSNETSFKSNRDLVLPQVESTSTTSVIVPTSNDSSNDSSNSSSSNPHLNEVDIALIKLNTKLEEVNLEFSSVESRINSMSIELYQYSEESQQHGEFLKSKWFETLSIWDSIQKDADNLGDELKEDKWLIVSRSVSFQAEEMMISLEKVLLQSISFISEVNKRQSQLQFSTTSPILSPQSSPYHVPIDLPSTSTSYFIDSTSVQPTLSSFLELNKSLQAKIKYYSPACDRVLKILEKGITDRRTKNGEVLRIFNEMKLRWKELLKKIEIVTEEMNGLEFNLKEISNKPPTPPSSTSSTNIATKLSLNKPSSTSTPTPFRKFANRMNSKSSPPISTTTPSSSSPKPISYTRPSPSPSSSNLRSISTPARPTKSSKRIDSIPDTFNTPSTSNLNNRPNNNRLSQSYSHSKSNLYPSIPTNNYNNRSKSPAPSNDGYGGSNYSTNTTTTNTVSKPRWNISTRRPITSSTTDEKEILLLDRTLGRTSIGGINGGTSYFQPMKNDTSPHSINGRHSSLGIGNRNRLSQQNFNSIDKRSPSPAFSNYSDSSTNYNNRMRPQTPTNIPRPRSRANSIGLNNLIPSNQSPLHLSPPPPSSSTTTHTPRLRVSSNSSIPQPSILTSGSGSLNRNQTPEPTIINQITKRTPYSRPLNSTTSIPTSTASNNNNNNNKRRSSYTTTTISSSRPTSAFGFTSNPINSNQLPIQKYKPISTDPLEQAITKIINSLPISIYIERIGTSNNYLFGNFNNNNNKALNCKLVERDGKKIKVLVKVGGIGYQDLEIFLLDLLKDSL